MQDGLAIIADHRGLLVLHDPAVTAVCVPFAVSNECLLRQTSAATSTLALADNFWRKANGYTVKDAISGHEIFRVESSPSDDTKWLVDAKESIPIAHLSRTVQTSTAVAYDLYVDQSDDQKQHLTQIDVDLLPLGDEPCRVTIEHPGTNKVSTVSVYGLWCERLAYIYLDHGTEERKAIAKVFRPDNGAAVVPFGEGEYQVQVAPGVDMAFIVLACAAMDDALLQGISETT